MTAIVTTPRLCLRHAREPDRPALIDLQSDPLARTHLGGAKTPAALPAVLLGDKPPAVRAAEVPFPEASGVIADRATDAFMGTVGLLRRLGFVERAQFELHNALQVLAVADLRQFR